MGMDAPESPKPQHSPPMPWQRRNDNPLMISYNDVFDNSLAVDQNSYLSFDLLGNFREIPSYFGVDDLLGRDPSSIYTL